MAIIECPPYAPTIKAVLDKNLVLVQWRNGETSVFDYRHFPDPKAQFEREVGSMLGPNAPIEWL